MSFQSVRKLGLIQRNLRSANTNMNGEYLISNANTDSPQVWDSNYGKFEVEDRNILTP